MDLSISPDLPFYVCYAVVLLLGAVTAWIQVSGRFQRNKWRAMQTVEGWALFSAYIAIPLLLFWLLDRAGAIKDTSLFAGVVVSVAYDRILAGGLKAMPVSGGLVSGFWTPFVAWADRVNQAVLLKSRNREQRLRERIIASVLRTPAKASDLIKLTIGRCASGTARAALQQDLDGLDAQAPQLGADYVAELRLGRCFEELATLPDTDYVLKEKGFIPGYLYWLDVVDLRSKLQFAGIIIVALAGLALAVLQFADADRLSGYNLWRLQKQNTSAVDAHRARTSLARYVAAGGPGDAAKRQRVVSTLADILQRPGLPIERAELVLGLLLETRASPGLAGVVPAALVDALRAPPDVRVRVQDALVFLATAPDARSDADPARAARLKALGEWKPLQDDSITIVEGKICAWREVFAATHADAESADASSQRAAPGSK